MELLALLFVAGQFQPCSLVQSKDLCVHYRHFTGSCKLITIFVWQIKSPIYRGRNIGEHRRGIAGIRKNGHAIVVCKIILEVAVFIYYVRQYAIHLLFLNSSYAMFNQLLVTMLAILTYNINSQFLSSLFGQFN